MSRLPLRLLSICALLLCTQQAAWAHAHPVSQSPAAEASVTAPKQVSMRFTETLEPSLSTLEVTDEQGKKVNQAATTVDPATPDTMHVSLPVLAHGRYVVKWTAVATDGHRTQGKFRFQVQ
ncbi:MULTISPECIES: copper homeostasis periplasmic binding protein CopC [unclassified Paludibacterium]|uniref:copper homeostasis periplasmic binding protein CopC n=1 Tax=unclassified Paludibacterium TaxID=2618429 RepID=UPI001C047685|nr:copper homeostasis periplasmic binding protein CopC [Paludibacterium sp. B53371]BEV72720.1 copper homeostasis periplasmic binding protein CopC [Paludibacterium sp. THUN1379]